VEITAFPGFASLAVQHHISLATSPGSLNAPLKELAPSPVSL